MTDQNFAPSIRNIWAVGRNYAEHAKELGNAVPSTAGEPMIFLKSGTSAVADRGGFRLPAFSKDPQHELEIALEFGPDLRFSALTLSIDMTARDLQNQLKAKGQPWTLCKSFRDSSLLGPRLALTPAIDLGNIEFNLKINGELRQKGNTRDMIFGAEALRTYLIERYPVVPGDWLMTGTPEGVGPVRPGDLLEAEIPGLLKASWRAAR